VAGSAASQVRAGTFAVFSPTTGATAKNMCLDEDGLFYVFTDSTATLVGTSVVPVQNPVFHGGAPAAGATAVYTGLVIMPDASALAVPKKYDGTTLSNLNGTPPMAKYAAVYKDYTVLANGKVGTTVYPNRVWFSPPGDPDCFGTAGVTAWDTTDSWIDFTVPVRGLASTKNALLVFGDGQITRVRGSAPPPDTDMTVDDPWQELGLLDAFGITVHEDIVYWLAPEGVYRSDGVYLDNITAKGGMLRYWLDMVASADAGWSWACGVIRNKMVIAVQNNGVFQDAFMVDLTSYAWTQLANLDATSFWDGIRENTENDDTFFGRREEAYVGRLETMFSEVGDSAYKNDGDGVPVTSVVETPFYELGNPGIKTVKSVFAGYHLKDFGSDNPSILVEYIDTPESESYVTLGNLTNTIEYNRRRLPLGGRHWGIGLRFTRVNAGDFFGYDLSAEVSVQEESKRIS
jgi:hypothetical protein